MVSSELKVGRTSLSAPSLAGTAWTIGSPFDNRGALRPARPTFSARRVWGTRGPAWCLLFALALFFGIAAQAASSSNECWTLDFRYAPPQWQTAICLPDDWQKTLVSNDGSLLYDYGGKGAGFGTRISFELQGGAQWVKQELVSPRVPIVQTRQRSGNVELVQEAFAIPPLPSSVSAEPPFVIERVGAETGQARWAAPPSGTDPAFRDVAIGWKEPVQYRFKAAKGARYTVVFGLCEGYHPKPGQRMLNLQFEGHSLRTVDLVAGKGRNQPQVFCFPARDEDQDGWVNLAVAATTNSPDQNSILNTLWVFREGDAPTPADLVAGRSAKPPLAHLDCGLDSGLGKPPRQDLACVHLRNVGNAETCVTPVLNLEGVLPIVPDQKNRRLQIGGGTTLTCSEPIQSIEERGGKLVVTFAECRLAPQGQKTLSCVISRGNGAGALPFEFAQVGAVRQRTEKFWRNLDLPYDRLQVPDPAVQGLLDSCVRNIYQAREIKKGLPAFQVGPTCYRGLWVVDGSFLLEAMTYLGRTNETRNGVKYLLSFQHPNGSVMLMHDHWKETGIALWAVTRHARLTGDKAWLREVWPKVEQGFAFIRHMRTMPGADAPNARLIPDGFSDGGLSEKVPEYTNIYWTMAGLRAAVEAARWLGLEAEAADWQKEYDDFLQTFRRAAARDLRKDAQGNAYLPIRMRYDPNIPPQKAQWAFLQSVFPGKVFEPSDSLVQGNMAMLKAVERQGLVLDTGWLKNGLWTYFGSFYGHAWLWLGDGEKAAETLYAFGNHASPLLAWREEQMPVGKGEEVVGDMPHNWASAEFIRLVRHSLMLERGDDLHLLEALPAAWVKPGAVVSARDILTEFGPVSLELQVSAGGDKATLRLTPPQRTAPKRIQLHLDHWSGSSGVRDLSTEGPSVTTIPLRKAG